MASEQLFDISGIDLSQVLLSTAQVQELNPQTGDMRHLDRVIWFSADNTECLGAKDVRPDEFWVEGHIPGRPLLPGVLMIEAAAQLCSVLFRQRTGEDRFLGFTRCDEVVFRGQVVPDNTLLLLVKEGRFSLRRFVCLTQGVVNGSLVFEAKITGMVL